MKTLLRRLASKEEVEGLLLFGSIDSERFSVSSDYDLILVLRGSEPAIETVATWIDGHLTEINCKTIEQLERLVSLIGVRDITGPGALVNQIRVSRIVFDRAGRLAALQQRLLEMPPPEPPGGREAYDWWFRIGYNLAHAKRYSAAEDPAYRLTAEVRLLYGIHETFMAYLLVRGVPWRGDKEGVKYLHLHDMGFLNALLDCMREIDLARKIERYEELARRALATVEVPWPPGTTTLGLGEMYAEDARDGRPSVEEAQAFWQRLIGV